MAEEKEHSAPSAPSASKGPLILALVNSLAVFGAMGMIVYTKFVFKRPAITESGERDRLEQMRSSPRPPDAPALVSFEPVTINIASVPYKPKGVDGSAQQIDGKLHYATIGFAVEVRNEKLKEMVEDLRSQISDLLLNSVGRKSFQELKNVQGRYILKSQLLEESNRLAQTRLQAMEAADPRKKLKASLGVREAVVTNVFFTSFIVQ